MIEVLFAESEAASMKAGKKKSLKREHTGWMEGTPEEVICLGFLLDIGDIREKVDSAYRKTLLHDLYTQEAWGKNPEVDAELWNLAEVYVRELQRLKNYLEEGERPSGSGTVMLLILCVVSIMYAASFRNITIRSGL